ncbi:Ca2+-binding EF-hand superfamily protein [Pseudomonas frederiksbergensis]
MIGSSAASSEELFSQLGTDSDGSVTANELSSALAGDSTSSTSTDTSAALLKVLDSDSRGSVSSDELKATLQAGREQNTDSSTEQFNATEALNKMIANPEQAVLARQRRDRGQIPERGDWVKSFAGKPRSRSWPVT